MQTDADSGTAMGHNGPVTAVMEIPELTGRLGGPLGPRASRAGSPWFDAARFALPLASLTMALCLLRQVPCRPLPGDFPNSYQRLCYSDIQATYFTRDLATGAGVYEGDVLGFSPLTIYIVQLANWLAGMAGQRDAATPFEQQMTGSTIFVVSTAIILTLFFMAAVVAHLKMGLPSASRNTDGVHVRAWDAVLIAISPVVLFAGLVSWDLAVVGLTSLALLAWSKNNPLSAGILFGLACAGRIYPLAIVLGIGLLAARAGKWRDWVTMLTTSIAVFLFTNLPVMVMNYAGWRGYWTKNISLLGPDLGSIWYLIQLIGIKIPGVYMIAPLTIGLAWLAIAYVVLRAPRRPRVGQVACLLVMSALLLNVGYPPQFALWLLPLVVLARPKLFDVAIWTAAEVGYYLAVWGFLDGIIGIDSSGEPMYWIAIAVRVCVQLWIILRIIDDINRPWEDPVRQPFVDDPIGGPLDHAVDAPWAARLAGVPTTSDAAA